MPRQFLNTLHAIRCNVPFYPELRRKVMWGYDPRPRRPLDRFLQAKSEVQYVNIKLHNVTSTGCF